MATLSTHYQHAFDLRATVIRLAKSVAHFFLFLAWNWGLYLLILSLVMVAGFAYWVHLFNVRLLGSGLATDLQNLPEGTQTVVLFIGGHKAAIKVKRRVRKFKQRFICKHS